MIIIIIIIDVGFKIDLETLLTEILAGTWVMAYQPDRSKTGVLIQLFVFM